MEYDEFIDRVQDRAELDSPEEAAVAVQATLGTLGEMLSPKERRDLAAELPKPLKDCLTLWVEQPPRELTHPHRFNLEEFYNRVAARSDVRYPAAVKHSQAVVQVLQQAVSRGELRDVLRELPDEYDELLSGQPRGPVSPSIVKQP
jgi:uncharacterized protein (DUF2267 family)